MEKKNDVVDLDLKEIFLVFVNKWQWIVLVGLFCAIVAFGYSKLMVTPMYTSTASIYVTNKQTTTSVTASDLQTSTLMTEDYVILAKSRTVLEQVISELDLSMNYKSLYSSVSVTAATDTRVVYISVSNADPYTAMLIADKLCEVASNQIQNIMNLDSIYVIDSANLPTSPSSPNVKKSTLLGGFLGAAAAALVVFLIWFFDDRIKRAEDIEHYLGLSTLGVIPVSQEESKGNKTGKTWKLKKD